MFPCLPLSLTNTCSRPAPLSCRATASVQNLPAGIPADSSPPTHCAHSRTFERWFLFFLPRRLPGSREWRRFITLAKVNLRRRRMLPCFFLFFLVSLCLLNACLPISFIQSPDSFHYSGAFASQLFWISNRATCDIPEKNPVFHKRPDKNNNNNFLVLPHQLPVTSSWTPLLLNPHSLWTLSQI